MKKIYAFLVLLSFLIVFGCIGQGTQQIGGTTTNAGVSIVEKAEKTSPAISEEDIPQIDDMPSDIDENFNGTDEI